MEKLTPEEFEIKLEKAIEDDTVSSMLRERMSFSKFLILLKHNIDISGIPLSRFEVTGIVPHFIRKLEEANGLEVHHLMMFAASHPSHLVSILKLIQKRDLTISQRSFHCIDTTDHFPDILSSFDADSKMIKIYLSSINVNANMLVNTPKDLLLKHKEELQPHYKKLSKWDVLRLIELDVDITDCMDYDSYICSLYIDTVKKRFDSMYRFDDLPTDLVNIIIRRNCDNLTSMKYILKKISIYDVSESTLNIIRTRGSEELIETLLTVMEFPTSCKNLLKLNGADFRKDAQILFKQLSSDEDLLKFITLWYSNKPSESDGVMIKINNSLARAFIMFSSQKQITKLLPELSCKIDIEDLKLLIQDDGTEDYLINKSLLEKYCTQSECPVCLDVKYMKKLPNCVHMICKDCLSRIKDDHGTCPLCRESIN